MLDVRSKSMVKVQRPVVGKRTATAAGRTMTLLFDRHHSVVSTRLELPQTGLRAVRYRHPRALNNQHWNLPLQLRIS
jgi:hypothetical protein